MGILDELAKFDELPEDQKFRFLFTTLYNHMGALKEMKWLIRIVAGTVATVAMKTIFF